MVTAGPAGHPSPVNSRPEEAMLTLSAQPVPPRLGHAAATFALSAATSRASRPHSQCIVLIDAQAQVLAHANGASHDSNAGALLFDRAWQAAALCLGIENVGCEHAPELAECRHCADQGLPIALPLYRGDVLLGAIGVASDHAADNAGIAEAGRAALSRHFAGAGR
jgi:uncharacterized protein GlcG (DUF336 family)